MAWEIERKFLVKGEGYKVNSSKSYYVQGYLVADKIRTVRVRIADNSAFLTIKGKTAGASRLELEYPIPLSDAEKMLHLCEKPLIEKYRYTLTVNGDIWEVDEFLGENEGLVIAEIELKDENQPFTKPGWLGKEVTGDPRYYNSNLIRFPYKAWPDKPLSI